MARIIVCSVMAAVAVFCLGTGLCVDLFGLGMGPALVQIAGAVVGAGSAAAVLCVALHVHSQQS